MTMRKSIFIAAPLALVLAGAGLYALRPKAAAAGADLKYKTAAVQRGAIQDTVSSTGTVQAVGTVAVLAQLTGTLEQVYVDFNDAVSKGQPLAKINTEKLQITLKEKQAALEKARAQLEYDSAEYAKSQKLFASALISESDLASGRLAYLSSKASLAQAEASYEDARLDLEKYAVVLSPISGIVLDKAVEAGETVVGSGSSNTELFTLAENLKVMEIKALVDELDISQVRLGQTARFTVEAYADKKFSGTVSQIRVVPTTSDNVVSYTVIVKAGNEDGLLLPGMTATLDFLVTEKQDVVLVPSAAFRFTPSEEVQAAARKRAFEERIKDLPEDQQAEAIKAYEERAKAGGTQAGGLLGGPRVALGGAGGPPPGAGGPGGPGAPGGGVAGNGSGAAAATRKPLWILEEDGSVSLRNVAVGASDASNTELLGADDLVGKAAILRAE